ncbi:UNVERIFIED_CONTAM: hypothetical protein Scaly_0332900 [Sesamum calycinum]|uniref:Coenzyme Q-binding protein COQ10 START domain-containing protein n=1 Tax=Sesamum calycinum TaxID=2727403 RepID=A0AAW2SBG1_9LAMI
MSVAAATAVVALVNQRILCPQKSSLLPLSSHLCANSLRNFTNYYAPRKRGSLYYLTGVKLQRSISPVMEWQDCTVKMEIDLPTSVAYKCYSDREAIPQWMPFISSVKILEDKPDLSRWSLKYKAFGRDIEFSWLARICRGAVRFFPKGAGSCVVELTVSYEVPQLLTPVASALQPFLESLLLRGLERFARFAKSYSAESTA